MSNYPAGIGNYFEEEAELLKREEMKWERIIDDIGESPFFKIDGEYFGEELAIKILNDEYGRGNYELDQWGVSDDEVFEKYLGGIWL